MMNRLFILVFACFLALPVLLGSAHTASQALAGVEDSACGHHHACSSDQTSGSCAVTCYDAISQATVVSLTSLPFLAIVTMVAFLFLLAVSSAVTASHAPIPVARRLDELRSVLKRE